MNSAASPAFCDPRGTLSAETRWTVLDDGFEGSESGDAAGWFPPVDLRLGGTAPTGRSHDEAARLTGSDVTGDGTWKLRLGLRTTRFVAPKHSVGASGEWAHRFSKTVDREGVSVERAAGPEVVGSLFYLYLPNVDWSFGAGASLRVGSAAEEDGVELPGTQTRRTGLNAHVTHAIAFPDWELTGAVTSDGWWDGAGRNVPFAGPSFSLTLRRQFL